MEEACSPSDRPVAVGGEDQNDQDLEKTLMNTPEEVIFNNIFPHLRLNDLLRLRRVNKGLKPLGEDYLQLHVTSESYFELDFSDDGDEKARTTLSSFLALDYVAPLSKLQLGEMKQETWEKEQVQEFVVIYGSKITHLKLKCLEIPIVSRKVIKFFESLPNLEHLEIDNVEERGRSNSFQQEGNYTVAANSKQLVKSLPSTFLRLRTLIIREFDCSKTLEAPALVWKFIEKWQLEFVRHPGMIYDSSKLPGGRFGAVQRILEGTGPSSKLKFYDIQPIDDEEVNIPTVTDFYKLVNTCAKYNVKLLNVNGNLIDGIRINMEDYRRNLSSVIASLQSLHEYVFLLELPHLEKISIGDAELWEGVSQFCSMPARFERKAWPNLKDLYILIDSSFLGTRNPFRGQECIETVQLFRFFFIGIRREKMEKLSLEFTEHSLDDYGPEDTIIPCPRIIDICNSCPNLKELTLTVWLGSNKAISKLWNNLPLLEKVKFRECDDLGNVAFVGEDKDNPELLKAKNLRSLTLWGLDTMPKITDTLFTLVLRHMPLRELHLFSSKSLKMGKITMNGISSLLKGAFSETIERFSLDIELDGVTAEELKKLENEFRSSKML